MIYKAFKNLHIKPTATVFIHADAIVAAQLEFKKNNLKFLQNYIIKFLKKNGTIVVPAFNQKSFAEKKFFNVNNLLTILCITTSFISSFSLCIYNCIVFEL